MNTPLLQQNNHHRQTSPSLERHRALQEGVAALLYLAFSGIVFLLRLVWGDIPLTDGATVGIVAGMVVKVPLLLMAVSLVSAGYHFVLYKKLHRQATDKTIVSLRIWDDLDASERSPAKIAVLFICGILLIVGFLASPAFF